MSNTEIIALIIVILFVTLPFIPIGFVLWKRYVKKNPYVIDSKAVDIINNSSVKEQSEALKIVYKKAKNKRVVSKFNRLMAKEIYYITKMNGEN